jgi:hypothetical protein
MSLTFLGVLTAKDIFLVLHFHHPQAKMNSSIFAYKSHTQISMWAFKCKLWQNTDYSSAV